MEQHVYCVVAQRLLHVRGSGGARNPVPPLTRHPPPRRWYECNTTHPLDGTIPYPLTGNTYLSGDGGYEMRCKDETWDLAQAQARGVDVGSSAAMLPTVEELVALGHATLGFA